MLENKDSGVYKVTGQITYEFTAEIKIDEPEIESVEGWIETLGEDSHLYLGKVVEYNYISERIKDL